MTNLWGREPAVVLGLIQAGLALLLSFGFELTVEQQGSIIAFSAVLIAVITRSQVTPIANVPDVVVSVETPEGTIEPRKLKIEEEK